MYDGFTEQPFHATDVRLRIFMIFYSKQDA